MVKLIKQILFCCDATFGAKLDLSFKTLRVILLIRSPNSTGNTNEITFKTSLANFY